MFVKEEIVESLCLDAGERRVKRAKEYLEQRRVQINEVKYENKDDFEVHAKVRGTENYYTHLIVRKGEIEDLICSCRDYEKNRSRFLYHYNGRRNKPALYLWRYGHLRPVRICLLQRGRRPDKATALYTDGECYATGKHLL